MADFIFPTSRELLAIAPEKFDRLMEGRIGFQIMPVREVKAARLQYEQRDNIRGLQRIRGYNGEFQRVSAVGGKQYDYVPGVYGEYMFIDEKELTTRRAYGQYGPVDLTDLVLERQDILMQRRVDRMEWAIWTLLATGVISVTDLEGQVLFTDTFPIQTFTAGVTWATVATATPLANIRAVKMQARGKGVTFGSAAKLYMNQSTAAFMLGNTNAADLGGKRTNGGDSINSINNVSEFTGRDDLPSVVVYDEGYLNDAGTYVPFIPDNKAILVGSRNQGRIGEFIETMNANNANSAPGPYQDVITTKAPIALKVVDGINGGPCLYYPGSVVVMNV